MSPDGFLFVWLLGVLSAVLVAGLVAGVSIALTNWWRGR